MVINIPKGIYTMEDRKAIISANAPLYRRSRKKIKSNLLNELVNVLKMNRKYISFLLRNSGKKLYRGKTIIVADLKSSLLYKRGRKKVYTKDVIRPLVEIWKLSGYLSSVHLVAFISVNREALMKSEVLLNLSNSTQEKLFKLSHATIDRILKPYREKFKIKRNYRSRSHISHIKKSVPISAFYDKPKEVFGYLEMDLVFHNGGDYKGEFNYTLTVTDIFSGWTELRAIKNKARVWTKEALSDILSTLPFKAIYLHCDNGSEFLNSHVENFVRNYPLIWTRSRPFKKNDSPFIESKNWSYVRTYTGYRRYDTEEELEVLKELNILISIKHNFFIPTMKIESKVKDDKSRKVHKTYSIKTPYQRLIESKYLSDKEKERLKIRKESLNYFEVCEKIKKLLIKLDKCYRNKYILKRSREHEYLNEF